MTQTIYKVKTEANALVESVNYTVNDASQARTTAAAEGSSYGNPLESVSLKGLPSLPGVGDSRLAASQNYGMRIWANPDKMAKLGLTANAHIIHGDLLLQDYSDADVLTVYLLPMSNDKVSPILEKQLKKGTRIVAHDFAGVAGA